MLSNVYSRRWFDFFHWDIDEKRTRREIAFVCSCAPLPNFRKVLDVCCGMGRHARALSQLGYSVSGIDRDADAIARARKLGGAQYTVADLRDYQPTAQTFDLVMAIGQSFGHFDEKTNRDILQHLAGAVRNGGRIILDLWNPEFFMANQGDRELKTSRGVVRETKNVINDRLFVQLKYPDRGEEKFEWQLFSPTQMKEAAESVGLALAISCTGFDATNFSSGEPRIQFVLERSK